MDARVRCGFLAAAALLSLGATYQTPNFVVDAPTAEIAQRVGQTAEKYRKELAIRWLGKEMPRWSQPCPIHVKVGDLGAGGTTTFACAHGEVFHWNMVVQGRLERILDSVLPHEVNHTVLASHFRRPLVRWADEGAATLVEDALEHQRQQRVLSGLLAQGRLIPLRQLLNMNDYPRDVAALYSQGFLLTRFLVQQGGYGKFLQFLADAESQNWETAIRTHYQVEGVDQLERKWIAWIRDGARDLVTPDPDRAFASAERLRRPEPNIIYRGQTPDEDDETQATEAGPSPRWGTHERSPAALAEATEPAGSLSPNGAPSPQAFPTGGGSTAEAGWTARGRSDIRGASEHEVPPPSRIAVAAGPDAARNGWSVDGNESGWYNPRTGQTVAALTPEGVTESQTSAALTESAAPPPAAPSAASPSGNDWGKQQPEHASASSSFEGLGEPIRVAPPVRRMVAAPTLEQPRRAPVSRPIPRRVIRGPVIAWPSSGST